VETCRVHGIVLDFLVSISKKENFVTLLGAPGVNPDPENKVRRLSLQEGSDIPTDLVLRNARSLTVFGHCVKVPSLLDLRHLRILDFEGYRELEDHHLADMGNLFHLKYLRLKYSKITKLPEQIAELQYLESLDICGNNRTNEIPSAINQLRRLVRLVVSEDTVLPDEIGGIKALQVLEGINVNTQSTNFIRQIGQLPNLRKLSISFINYYAGDNWKENQEEMVSAICRLGKQTFMSYILKSTREQMRYSRSHGALLRIAFGNLLSRWIQYQGYQDGLAHLSTSRNYSSLCGISSRKTW